MSVGEGNDVPLGVLQGDDCGAFDQLCLLVLAERNSQTQRVAQRYPSGAHMLA